MSQPRFELARTLNGSQYDWAKKFPLHEDELLAQAPEDKELFETERVETFGKINDFFGLSDDANPFEFIDFIETTTSTLEEKYQGNMFERQVDKVEAFTEKEVIERQEVPITTFERPRRKERDEDSVERESREFRLDMERQSGGFTKRTEAEKNSRYGGMTSGYTKTSSGTNSYANRTSTANKTTTKKEDGKPSKAIDHFFSMNDSVQRVGASSVRGWTKKQETDERDNYDKFGSPVRGWRKWVRKAKKIVKGNKGRIMLKVGATIALQFGMAVFGKKYEFENAGQMAMMFSMMLGTFFLSRELAEDGIDISGFNIL